MFELAISTDGGKLLKRFDLSRVGMPGKDGTCGGSATGLGAGCIVIGRATDCDIRIKSGRISRHHCAIVRDGDDWIVRDLGSTHGTEVEGVKISEAAVIPGLRVRIGPAVLHFLLGQPPSASHLAAPAGQADDQSGTPRS